MSEIWSQLKAHRKRLKKVRTTDLFDGDPERFDKFSGQAGDLFLDLSKVKLDGPAMAALLKLADERDVAARRDAMFSGEPINDTEGRAVLHTALRAPQDAVITVDGVNVVPEVHATLARMSAFCDAVRAGKIAAGDGEPFTDVVNIGIGGSDLGPVMATEALVPYHDGPRTHFVSNIDGADIADTLRPLDPKRTLIIVASKTFTTIETMTNAQTAMDWLLGAMEKSAANQHLAALSSAVEKATDFGVPKDRIFGFEDWVGGRYSLWGPIGLSIMLAIGPEDFRDFLDGAAAMDAHFQDAPVSANMPVLFAMVGIWHNSVCGYASRAVLPYENRLHRLPAYLQQLDMESNGKSVRRDGQKAEVATGPIVWGEPGTNGQHAFYQLIHQGTRVIPCEFMVAREAHEAHLTHQHRLLVANCLAQSEALLRGRDLDEARTLMAAAGFEGDELQRQAAHRVFPGDRPSTTLIYPKLTPSVLGQIIALYEHRVFVEGAIWGINSFDQWGVELGKILATDMAPLLDGADAHSKDGSTQGLIAHMRSD
ncbi:MAG: glucose-6-phosphate isomerase [Pseudomonadota bacterium]